MLSVLVIEDDKKINKLFRAILEKNNYQAISAFDGEEAMDILDSQHVDLIISDIMMPNMNGYEFVESLRDANYTTPILMITAKESFEDKEKAYDLGIDDYMVKPIDINEMMLRVNALFRRVKIKTSNKVTIGDIHLDSESLTISNSDMELLLPQKEFNLLYKLCSYPNKIFTRQQLMNEIWGLDSESDERTVDVHVNRLRDRLKGHDKLDIVTVRGLGYKVVEYS